jgi:8-amino-7-oxononanoate synthase
MINDLLKTFCHELQQKGLYRERQLPPTQICLNFSSSDYLSLREEPELKTAFQRGFAKYPTGSGGSMVVCGYHPTHRELEQAFAQTLNAQDALLFTSGYAANLAVITLLSRMGANLHIDRGVHASFYDGIRLNRSHFTRFFHNDVGALDGALNNTGANPVVITEGVFSMSGQMAPLKEISRVCMRHACEIIVDEAHAFGVFGPKGLGATPHHELTQDEIALRIIPFGKAFGCQGAIVVGRQHWIDALLQSARSYIYSTALSPAIAHGLLATLGFIQEAEDRRAKLFSLINYFREAVSKSPLRWRDSYTPIQQLQLGCPQQALYYGERLKQKNIFCYPMRKPTVSTKETGLRIVLNYAHETKDIEFLLAQLHQIHESTH